LWGSEQEKGEIIGLSWVEREYTSCISGQTDTECNNIGLLLLLYYFAFPVLIIFGALSSHVIIIIMRKILVFSTLWQKVNPYQSSVVIYLLWNSRKKMVQLLERNSLIVSIFFSQNSGDDATDMPLLNMVGFSVHVHPCQ